MVPEPSNELSTGMVVVAETNAAALSENAFRASPQTTNTSRPPCVERLRRTLMKMTERMATSAIGNAARKYEANEDAGNKYACGRDSAPPMKAMSAVDGNGTGTPRATE